MPAAARMVRLLPTTWAIVTRAGSRRDELIRVQTPAGSYHRTLRTLTGAWRDCQRLMADPAAAARNRPVAIGLWRMAVLVGSQDQDPTAIAVRVSCAKTAQVLVTAATGLGLSPTVQPSTRAAVHTVLITQRHQVARLRAEMVDPVRAHRIDSAPHRPAEDGDATALRPRVTARRPQAIS